MLLSPKLATKRNWPSGVTTTARGVVPAVTSPPLGVSAPVAPMSKTRMPPSSVAKSRAPSGAIATALGDVTWTGEPGTGVSAPVAESIEYPEIESPPTIIVLAT